MTVHYVSNNPKNHHWVILAKSSSDEYIGKLCAITSFVRFVSSVTSTTWEKEWIFPLICVVLVQWKNFYFPAIYQSHLCPLLHLKPHASGQQSHVFTPASLEDLFWPPKRGQLSRKKRLKVANVLML